MDNLQASIQNILDGQGVGIAITGMSIVFVALALTSLCIFVLPKLLERVARIYPESAGHGKRPAPRPDTPAPAAPAAPARDEAEVVAAIAFACHAAAQGQPVDS